jgi:phage host-nuclease inhibitor protein Gam
MRIHQEPMKAQLASLTAKLDAMGAMPRAPGSLGGKTATELLAEGSIEHRIDPKYPQAIGVLTVVERISKYGNPHW